MLIVEDDPDLLSLVAMILRDAGYDVAAAEDGLQALARIEERMPGVILLDMRMPVMNGWEFAREYRARFARAAPIVVVTAAEDARARAQEIGADAWLEKPFDLDDVVRTVARFLGPSEAATTT
ncbi:MAG TPA: response regulator [Anaeromyxobacteraceae bacterium]|nr:response regulator [Anaeromyxobacteraceae bacterium]